MLVFFIHGVNTQSSKYADTLIKNIRKNIKTPINFYSSFWGNLFNDKKHQIIGYIEKDHSHACNLHQEYQNYHSDTYRYKKQRNELINDFLGDFLIYQNSQRGKIIRQTISEQLNQFLKNHPQDNQIHVITHSFGSFILWDLLFSKELPNHDPAFTFREILSSINIESITTMGSPLLFLKQMLDLDFSIIHEALENRSQKNINVADDLRWVNVIHSSDLIAYPLKAAIDNEISRKLDFFDQYIWQCANSFEQTFINLGQLDLAMTVAAKDAHSSYFQGNIDGTITAKIITDNLLGNSKRLKDRCIHPK
ncbi:hypothetical protein PN441_10290 [Spirulina major CS-329]|uniref:hypothetical protein n=1 Tax=Spirulina TaxID=1154 RepID=UPI00232E9E20|nr:MULTISPECIES: hypothetical protein [Spirulina]MDB9496854.1 hypothetical protein [Spirulina subsalsa CS-330]MDB9503458.1 hypothetical protein [Spirulina major CS-329]